MLVNSSVGCALQHEEQNFNLQDEHCSALLTIGRNFFLHPAHALALIKPCLQLAYFKARYRNDIASTENLKSYNLYSPGRRADLRRRVKQEKEKFPNLKLSRSGIGLFRRDLTRWDFEAHPSP